MKTALWRGQVKDPLLPLRSSLRLTDFVIQPEKTVISGISSSGRAMGMQPGAHVGSTAALLPPGLEQGPAPCHDTCRGMGQPTPPCLILRGETQLRPGKGPLSPQGAPHAVPASSLRPQSCSAPLFLRGLLLPSQLPHRDTKHQDPLQMKL